MGQVVGPILGHAHGMPVSVGRNLEFIGLDHPFDIRRGQAEKGSELGGWVGSTQNAYGFRPSSRCLGKDL